MCGRYAAFRSVDEIRRLFATVNPPVNYSPTWNMAPTRLAPVVRRHPGEGARHLDLLAWGLVPHWATDPKKERRPINARSETVARLPVFRDAFARRRCIVPVDSYYEWQEVAGAKLPSAIARADGAPLALAGLWEGWRGADGEVLRTYAILTTSACKALEYFHDRMPVVLEPDDWAVWLGEAEGAAGDLLRSSEAGFRSWPVSSKVNNVRNDGPELLEEVAP